MKPPLPSVAAQSRRRDGSSESESRLGLVVSELNDQQKAELQVEGGLIVEDLKGAGRAQPVAARRCDSRCR